MKEKSPYQLAEETVDHVTGQCNRISKINNDSSDVERVQVLNYLRTVRTTIELMEHEIMRLSR